MSGTLSLDTGATGRAPTPAEAAWLRRLDRVLRAAPDSLVFATQGDGLMVWCRDVHEALLANGVGDCDGAVDRAGGSVASLSAVTIHGVSG